jgi:hypothetical protein
MLGRLISVEFTNSRPEMKISEDQYRVMVDTIPALVWCTGNMRELQNVTGVNGAAKKLGIPRQTLDARIASLGIDKYRFKTA